MLYCPRCNNTHWTLAPPESQNRWARLLLKRSYRCIKCGAIKLASIFQAHERERSVAEVCCPGCGALTHRVRRTPLERLLVFCRAFRCEGCRRRFRKFKIGRF